MDTGKGAAALKVDVRDMSMADFCRKANLVLLCQWGTMTHTQGARRPRSWLASILMFVYVAMSLVWLGVLVGLFATLFLKCLHLQISYYMHGQRGMSSNGESNPIALATAKGLESRQADPKDLILEAALLYESDPAFFAAGAITGMLVVEGLRLVLLMHTRELFAFRVWGDLVVCLTAHFLLRYVLPGFKFLGCFICSMSAVYYLGFFVDIFVLEMWSPFMKLTVTDPDLLFTILCCSALVCGAMIVTYPKIHRTNSLFKHHYTSVLSRAMKALLLCVNLGVLFVCSIMFTFCASCVFIDLELFIYVDLGPLLNHWWSNRSTQLVPDLRPFAQALIPTLVPPLSLAALRTNLIFGLKDCTTFVVCDLLRQARSFLLRCCKLWQTLFEAVPAFVLARFFLAKDSSRASTSSRLTACDLENTRNGAEQ